MEKYTAPEQHLSDVLKLYFMNAKKTIESEGFLDVILQREEITEDVFLPIIHIRKVFGISNAESLYTMVALSIVGRTLAESEAPDDIGKALIRRSLRHIMEGDKLKPRITDFILDPYTPLDRHYLTYSSKRSIIPNISVAERLANLSKAFLNKSDLNIIWVTGAFGSGRKTHIAHALGKMSVIFADIGSIAGHSDFHVNLDEIIFEHKLLGAVPCFWNIPEGEAVAFMNRLRNMRGLVFIAAEYAPVVTDILTVVEVRLPSPDISHSQSLWEFFIRDYKFTDELDTTHLSENFNLVPLEMKQSLQQASAEAVAGGERKIAPKSLHAINRRSRLKKLPTLGTPVNVSVKWADLIVPQQTKEQLEQVVQRIAHRRRVFREWGFDLVLPYGQGTTVLLEGSPGTGKTMAAYALAERIGLPMYKVDLSATVSKFIGETEKNLQAIFDEAAKADCILFFDEAEALFSKRTDVKDSKDKFSNLETSFLLQRLEEFQGLTVLATNLAKNFDDAFKRRFHFIINLPLPNKDEREQIWRAALPPTVPITSDISFEFLAARYEISGSKIKNIALSAAFEAAATGADISMTLLLDIISREPTLQ